MKTMSAKKAAELGFSADKRKRRRQHRAAARRLTEFDRMLGERPAVGTVSHGVASWHLNQARFL